MAVVNTNIGASVAQAALVKNSRDLSSAMQQLSTGQKINSAADNASGLAISNRMTSQINGLGAANISYQIPTIGAKNPVFFPPEFPRDYHPEER